jgi:hypothetical protein
VDHGNHWYGHAHILARYCGLDPARPPRIPGVVQHGWNVLDGYGPKQPFEPGWVKFVWSDVCRRRGWAMGRRGYHSLGAPWNYLLAMEPDDGGAEERTGTIWYPFHGWEFQEVTGDHLRLIETIKEVETGPVTVCLYWLEYRNETVRRLYESAGFRVISHGVRGWRWRNTDTEFLYKQLAELRRHRRVASNRLSTAILYGASVGCAAAVYGDPMVLQEANPVFGGVTRLERLWPELHGTSIDPAVAREFAAAELGVPYVVSPEELREIFGWPLETT